MFLREDAGLVHPFESPCVLRLMRAVQDDRVGLVPGQVRMAGQVALKTALSGWHIVTPHPAEMSRLTGRGIGEILSDPVRAAQGFAEEHGCTVLLKNAVTVIASPDGRLRYNASGSPALAKGGSGDVLTGIVTALLAQGLSPFDAASAGAFLLGASACKAAELLKTRLTTASDVTDALEGALL